MKCVLYLVVVLCFFCGRTLARSSSYILPGLDSYYDDNDPESVVNRVDFENFLDDIYRESARERADYDLSSPIQNDRLDSFEPFPDAQADERQSMNDGLWEFLENTDYENGGREYGLVTDEPRNPWEDIAETNILNSQKEKEELFDFALLQDILDDINQEEEENRWDLPETYTESLYEQDGDQNPVLLSDEDSVTSDGKKERGQGSREEGDSRQARGDSSTTVTHSLSQSDEDQLRSLITELEDTAVMKKTGKAQESNATSTGRAGKDDDITMEVKLPGVSVSQDDTYLCTATNISEYIGNHEQSIYITKYIPHAKQSVAHHMLIYGCMNPGQQKPGSVWNCGGPMEGSKKDRYPLGGICGEGGSQILWAWAKDAPAFSLPKDIGFKVGPGTQVKYLVLQVHYKSAKVFRGGKKDYSGVTVTASKTRMPRLAGVYILASAMGTVMPGKKKDFDIYCRYQQSFKIHPFAFRTHAHALGVEVMGFRIRDGDWTLIGAKNPQLPEAFYPMEQKNTTIRYGDILAARCVMYNFRNIPTSIGWRHTDEMCNFYFMFWTESKNEEKMDAWQKSCGNGFPWVHWSDLPGFYT